MSDFKKLEIWKRSMELANAVYEVTKNFPEEEKFGLTSQIRRCVVSVASNIAEGAGRNSVAEFNRFLNYAYGSMYELETQMLIAKNQELIETDIHLKMAKEIDEIQKMIYAFRKSLSQRCNF